MKVGRPRKYDFEPGTRYGSRVILAEAGRNQSGVLVLRVRCDCGSVADLSSSNVQRATLHCRQCTPALVGKRKVKPAAPLRPIGEKPKAKRVQMRSGMRIEMRGNLTVCHHPDDYEGPRTMEELREYQRTAKV